MNFHDPKHPLWSLLQDIVMATTMIILCATLYKNGLDPKDLVLIITTLGSKAGVNLIRKKVTG